MAVQGGCYMSRRVSIDGTADESIATAEKVLDQYAVLATDGRSPLHCALFDLFGYSNHAGLDFDRALDLVRSDWEDEFGRTHPMIVPGTELERRLTDAESLLRRLSEWARHRGEKDAPVW